MAAGISTVVKGLVLGKGLIFSPPLLGYPLPEALALGVCDQLWLGKGAAGTGRAFIWHNENALFNSNKKRKTKNKVNNSCPGTVDSTL